MTEQTSNHHVSTSQSIIVAFCVFDSFPQRRLTETEPTSGQISVFVGETGNTYLVIILFTRSFDFIFNHGIDRAVIIIVAIEQRKLGKIKGRFLVLRRIFSI